MVTIGTRRAISGHFRVPELSYLVSSVQVIAGTGIAKEVAMSPTITSLDQIDLDISIAFIALGAARHAFTRCPSGENAKAVDDAEAALNRRLDARLVAQQ